MTAGSGPDRDDDLLDIRQAAAFLRVSQTSLRRWTNAGSLPCLRVGGRRERRFRRSDLLAQLEQHPAVPTELRPGHLANPLQLACLHSTPEGRTRQAVQALSAGLQDQRRCYLVGSADAHSTVLAGLALLRPNLSAEIEDQRLRLVPRRATAGEQLIFWEAALTEARRDAVGSLCLVSDAAEHLSKPDVAAYEDRFHALLAAGPPAQTLCSYDARRLTGEELLQVLVQHPDTLSDPARQLTLS